MSGSMALTAKGGQHPDFQIRLLNPFAPSHDPLRDPPLNNTTYTTSIIENIHILCG